ncbi:MAG: hypothetical protein J6386_15980 [Candidatus Synoicihabitans palmerolidicus]|nr:hypothetical protein [Candidatus Synoicihabitans palmerolidicus]
MCNLAAGLDTPEGIHEEMTESYTRTYPEMVIGLEATALETLAEPEGGYCQCGCSLKANPPGFAQAMTGWR